MKPLRKLLQMDRINIVSSGLAEIGKQLDAAYNEAKEDRNH